MVLLKTLFLDIGNSKAKLCSFSQNWKVESELSRNEYGKLNDWLREFSLQFDQLIWTSVLTKSQLNFNVDFFKKVIHVSFDKIPAKFLNYESPQTLGLDRFLACLGAFKESQSAVIVIDAGTALTVDLMDENGVFQGGTISPGLKLWEQSLQTAAPALPLVQREIPHFWPPKTTDEALRWGIAGGFTLLVSSLVNEWKKKYPLAQIWCTGGDADFVKKWIPESQKDAFLVQKGMYEFILNDLK